MDLQEEKKVSSEKKRDTKNQSVELSPKVLEDLESQSETPFRVNAEEGVMLIKDLSDLVKQKPEYRQVVVGFLRKRVGNYAEKLLDSTSFRGTLMRLAENLSYPLLGDGSVLLSHDESFLDKLIVLHEMFDGDPRKLVEIIDLLPRVKNTGDYQINYSVLSDILNVDTPSVHEPTGELEYRIGCEINYEDPFDPLSNVSVKREFNKFVEVREVDGKMVTTPKKVVTHMVCELPKKLQANGMVKDVFRDLLPEYDRMGIDKIELHADIKIGSYAWAVYGFSWDIDTIINNSLKNPDVAFEKFLVKCIDLAGKNADMVSSHAKCSRDLFEPYLQACRDKGVLLTPQFIANLGRESKERFYYVKDYWYTKALLEEAKKEGKITKEQRDDAMTLPYHIGKVFLRDNGWDGMVDLKDRALLDAYLAL
jgi:hypothetical protein